MRLKNEALVVILLVVAAIAVFTMIWNSQRPSAPKASDQPPQAERSKRSRVPLQGEDETLTGEQQKLSPSAQRIVDALSQKLRPGRGAEIVDLGGITADLEEYRLRHMTAGEILAIIDAINFGSPSLESQAPFFILETMAEILRDKTTDKDVAWIDGRLEQAKEIYEKAKWLKVLESVGHAGNEVGFVEIFNNLPEKIGEDKMEPKAELVGRVLGRISTETAVRALLAAANENNDAKQVAIERAVGYVHTTDAIRAIAEVIDNTAPKSPRQVRLATEMLGSIPSEYSVLALKNLSANPDPEMAKVAADVLAQLLQYNPGLREVNKSN